MEEKCFTVLRRRFGGSTARLAILVFIRKSPRHAPRVSHHGARARASVQSPVCSEHSLSLSSRSLQDSNKRKGEHENFLSANWQFWPNPRL